MTRIVYSRRELVFKLVCQSELSPAVENTFKPIAINCNLFIQFVLMNLIQNIVQGIRLAPLDGSGRHQATALMQLSDTSGDRHPSMQLLTGLQALGIGLGLLLTLCSQPFMRTGMDFEHKYHRGNRSTSLRDRSRLCSQASTRDKSAGINYLQHIQVLDSPCEKAAHPFYNEGG